MCTGRDLTIGAWAVLIALTASLAAFGHPEPAPAATDEHDIHAREHRLAGHFDGPFITHSTTNFRLHSNHAEWAQEAGELLEHTHQRFYEIWGELAQPLEEPLTWVGFKQRDQFNRYAQEVDRIDMSWSDGYYSARTNRVVVVHPTSRSSRGAAARRNSDSEVLGQDGHEEEQAAEAGDADADASATPRALTDTGQVTHEAAHQIAFNSGLQRRGVMYPLWVSEGLATNFETNADDDFGPDVDNPNRRRQLLRAFNGGRLMPLEDLIVMTRVPRSQPGQSISEVYAQCWAFFQFLYTHREAQLKQYLADLARKSPGHRRNRTLRQEFFQTFGRLADIERDYHAFIRKDIARR